jgi:hypothetical protein
MTGMTMSEGLPPAGATHVGWFYGDPTYYRMTQHQHLNQVGEEWQTRFAWTYWDWNKRQWLDVGSGFSTRTLKELE